MSSSRAAGLRTGIVQIALSVLDGQGSHDWYALGLGLLPAGTLQPTADLAPVQGIPKATVANLLWLVDGNPFFQFEIFQYASPPVRTQPADRQACDLGYSRLGVWVADLDETIERLSALGTFPLTDPVGRPGERRVCVADPDGILIELMEDRAPTPHQAPSTRPSASAAARSITVSVHDLEAAQRYYVDAIGMIPVPDVALHSDEHEQLWLLPGATGHRSLLAGGDLWLELVQYTDPVGRPPRTDYRISDQGILNIAVAGRSVKAFEALRDRVLAHGYGVHAPIIRDRMRVQYAYSTEGLSVEMAYFDEERDSVQGFLPVAPPTG